MDNYPHLFAPIQIGTQTVKNRIFMPPISTNLADKCYVTDELIQHYGARAKGGVGRSKLAMRMMEKGVRIESGAKVGNIKDAISGAYELARTL